MKLCPGIQVLLNVEGEFLIIIGGVFVVRVLGQIVFVRQEGTDASQLQDAFAAVHNSQFITAHELFATLSSDEFKKTAAAKKNLCGCRSNWRLEAKKSPVVPGK